ncbi:NAD(P)/FAD-dependent oxidoreductase [Dyadobacter sp. Leaf189]|uniref:FAD-dependent oxidoreductase n=1 Tax=Dyadobacter sp. Leaf189 TaxID=1736295 RepID=UPI000700A5AF|nr:NAD(P)/FAD-dependent oxidoreductase [Dyadobacter sp. Leaf189]KQS27884.1 2-polyprenyl-6-methoxyphenol hydroxylase [Dyadobacter sp. Leaf189]
MVIENKTIAIVGGGPGGLTLARLLQMRGAQVKVYERDINKDVRVQGATLDLHQESGLAALGQAGLLEAFFANYRPDAGKLRVTDQHARIQLDDHTSESVTEDRPEIDRGPLRRLLIDSLNDETIVWNSHFLSMDKSGSGWLLHFKNGTSAYADIVIAADGANSKIRPYITDIQPIYSGITIVEGNVYHAEKNAPHLHQLTKGGKVFAFGHEQSLILSAKGDGSLSFYTGCKSPEYWVKESGIDFANKQEVLHWFKEAFGSWDEIWQELFAGDELWFVPRPQYHYPTDQQWEPLANLTMIGDAAHRMPPYAGEGVNMAMQDAMELASHLVSDAYVTIQEAIASFEQQMCKRGGIVTQITLESTEMLHSEGAVSKLLGMFENAGQHDIEH